MEFNSAIGDDDLVEGLNIMYFKYSKIWSILNHYRVKRERSWALYAGLAITMVSMLSYVVMQLVCFFSISVDLKEASLLILNPLTAIQSLVKVGVFFLFIEKQSAIMNLFRKDFLPSITPEKRQRVSHIIRKLSSQSNLFCFLASLVNTCCVSVWNFLPIVRSKMVGNLLGIQLQSNDGDSNKILGGCYPFPYSETPWYEGVYVYEFFCCSWCGFIINVYEILIISLVMMLGTHLTVLGQCISQVTEDTKSNKENRIDLHPSQKVGSTGISSNDQLLLYLKDHQMLMRVGDEFKKMFNFLITMQLGLGLLIMTISVFHFIFDQKDPIVIFKFMLYLTYQLTEIVLYCYCGTFLETSSTDIEFSMYNSEWYTMNKRFRATAQMIMVRARRPVSLIAVRLYPVNSITLLSMMQFTFSTSTFLSRLIENP